MDSRSDAPGGAPAPAGGAAPRPVLRGWSHAVAALAAVVVTGALCRASRDDVPRAISLLVFGLSMVELYVVSAVYHIGRWSDPVRARLRAIDHANIYVLIAGTYTPICFNVLTGGTRIAMLVAVWSLAIVGCGLSVFVHRVPRWLGAGLYVGMGWIGVLTIPRFVDLLRWPAVSVLLAGGVLYTIGAVIYGLKRPDPYPRTFGFHEIFHLCVIAGSAAFVIMIWIWVLPYPRA